MERLIIVLAHFRDSVLASPSLVWPIQRLPPLLIRGSPPPHFARSLPGLMGSLRNHHKGGGGVTSTGSAAVYTANRASTLHIGNEPFLPPGAAEIPKPLRPIWKHSSSDNKIIRSLVQQTSCRLREEGAE